MPERNGGFSFLVPRYSGNAWLGRLEAGQREAEDSDSEGTTCAPILRCSLGRELNKFETRITSTLHRFGLTIIFISIIDNINDFVSDSRHLAKHHWLSSFDCSAPYALWIGVLFVFAGIVVRDRSWRKSPVQSSQLSAVRFEENDLFDADIHAATVVTLFLLNSVNEKLRPKLLKDLKPGTRVVSNTFGMGDWKPDKQMNVGDPVEGFSLSRTLFLWTIPQRNDKLLFLAHLPKPDQPEPKPAPGEPPRIWGGHYDPKLTIPALLTLPVSQPQKLQPSSVPSLHAQGEPSKKYKAAVVENAGVQQPPRSSAESVSRSTWTQTESKSGKGSVPVFSFEFLEIL